MDSVKKKFKVKLKTDARDFFLLFKTPFMKNRINIPNILYAIVYLNKPFAEKDIFSSYLYY